VAIPKGQPVGFRVLDKLAKHRCKQIFIKPSDENAWNAWVSHRHPQAQPAEPQKKKENEGAQKALYGNKRAELLSYVQKTLQKKAEGDSNLDKAFAHTREVMQKVIALPTLDWYFQQFHEPPDLFQHNGRVAHGLTVFLHLYRIGNESELESACYSALIHELEGDPAANTKTVVSQQTLSLLEKKGRPVPKEVIQMIELHDELFSGKGFPNNKKAAEIPVPVRAFTLFNHFDSHLMGIKGTRRIRFDKAKIAMDTRKEDYDPALWKNFWEFWERHVEAVW
jgi:hypothetical protein